LFGWAYRSSRSLSVIKGAHYLQRLLSLMESSIPIIAALNHARELTVKVPLVGIKVPLVSGQVCRIIFRLISVE